MTRSRSRLTSVLGPGTLVAILLLTPAASTAAGTWTTKASMTINRGAGHAVGVVNGIVFVAGGGGPIGALEAYDPNTDTWTTKASMTPRGQPAAAGIGSLLYVVGGASGGTRFTTLEIYSPDTDTWSPGAAMPTARDGLGVAVVGGILYAVGGIGSLSTNLDAVEKYDPRLNSWTSGLAPMPTARRQMAVEAVNGLIYAIGGFGGITGSGGGSALATVEAYDPASDSWTTKASLPFARLVMGSGVIDGKIYVVGGLGLGNSFLDTVSVYDPISNSWSNDTPMPTARSHVASGVAGGTLYALGGQSPTTPLLTNEAFVPLPSVNLIPFDPFDIDRARVELDRGATRDRFRVQGVFELGAGNNGIDVLNEDVTVTFDGFTETIIPAGSFFRDDDDEGFQYNGFPVGIKRISIRDDGKFEVRARGLDLSGIDLDNPVPFSLQIGDDFGETEITFDDKGRFRQ